MNMGYVWSNGSSGGGTYNDADTLRERLHSMVDAMVERAERGEGTFESVSITVSVPKRQVGK